MACIIALGNECLTSPDDLGCLCFHYAAAGDQTVALDLICTDIACSGAFLEVALFVQDDSEVIVVYIPAEFDSLDMCERHYNRFQCAEAFGDATHYDTRLHWACSRHSAKCVRLVGDLKIERIMSRDWVFAIDFKLEFGIETPLSLLMKLSALKLIAIAQRAGADVNCILEHAWLLLFRMIRSHSVTALAYMCRFGVDVNWKSSEGWTAIHMAAQE
jgi:ankyrin repeat protein